MRIISWNVNGIRSNIVDGNKASYKKERVIKEGSPIDQLITNYDPDIICFQETRLGEDLYHYFNNDEIKKYFPYQYWSSSQGEKGRAGNRYSGTSIWCKKEPKAVYYDFEELGDKEGRFIRIDYDNLIVITTYTPNTGSNWEYRLKHWEPAIRKYLQNLSQGDVPVVYNGDNNIANKEDVWFGCLLDQRAEQESDPSEKKRLQRKVKSKQKLHSGEEILCGYSKQEQDAYKQLLQQCQLVDCQRVLYPNTVDQFSWYNIRIRQSFSSNQGWLIDRFLLQEKYKQNIKECKIISEMGVRQNGVFISDHLPIYLELELK